MRKDKFSELIRRSLPTDHNKSVVDGYISLGYDAFVKNMFAKNGYYNEYFAKTFVDVPVQKYHDKDIYYSTLPAKVLNIKRPGGGVWTIDTTGTYDLTFVPIADMTHKIISNLTALKIPSHIPFALFGNEVQYRVRALPIEKVNMNLLVQFDEYEPSDDISFPDGAELQIRELVMNYLQHKIPEANGQ